MITKKKLNYFIKDERNAAKVYRKYGFSGLARDESRHRKFLIRKLKKLK